MPRRNNITSSKADRRGRSPLRCRRLPEMLPGMLLALLLVLTALPVFAADEPARTLVLEDIRLEGATRTSLEVVSRDLPLEPGQALDQAALVAAIASLREGGLFAEVDFYTEPGAERGRLVLVLEVVEHDFDFRWALGNTDLDGWYLAPAMLAHENPFGRGGSADLQWRIGFRHNGLQLRYTQPRVDGGRAYRETRLGLFNTDRPYFADGVEYRHEVGTFGLATVYGRRFGDRDVGELGLKIESMDVADRSTAYTASADGSIDYDQRIGTDQMPAAVAEAVGRSGRAVVHADWRRDTRTERLRAGTPVGGEWGRIRAHAVLQDQASHPGLEADLRLFREVPGGVLAARLRGAWVGDAARFHDRLHLGGMYSVRGFATHSLSSPGGDTWQAIGSLEYRTTINRDARGAKLVGLFFVDAGAGGASDATDPFDEIAVGVGYGARWRVQWLGWFGVDLGFPLTDGPLDQNFQATASIGWSF